jgi:putative sugar O-methyltransferase
MIESMKAAPPIYAPSTFWEQLVERHIEELETDGFENFKRTVNMKYFNWGVLGIFRHLMVPTLTHWLKHPTLGPLAAHFPDHRASAGPRSKSFNAGSAIVYKTYVALLADLLSASDPLDLLTRLSEPDVGHPFVVEHRGRRLSQDLCNSIHEFYSATSRSDLSQPNFRVGELGAGYGRLAPVFLSALPGSSYTIIDIPPALYVSQRYLTEVLPELPAFKFRDFTSFDQVKTEFERSRIRFLAAHQIELLPRDSFDLFVNISSLHEMVLPQIEHYLKQIDRVCRGHFYSKQWRVSRAKVNGFVIREDEYPIPKTWVQLLHRHHPLQRMFFDALWLTRPLKP